MTADNTDNVSEWVSVSQAAKQLGCSNKTIYRDLLLLPPSAVRQSPKKPIKVHFPTLVDIRTGKIDPFIPPSPVIGQDEMTENVSVTESHDGTESGHEEYLLSHIETLKRHVESLERQLEASRVAESEMRRLLLTDRQEISEMRQLLLRAKEKTEQDVAEGINEPERLPEQASVVPEGRALTLWEKLFGKRGGR